MTTTGSQQPKSCHALLLQHRAKITGKGWVEVCRWRERRKKTRRVMETEPCVLPTSPLPRTLPTQPFSITGCFFQAWEWRLTASSRGSINSRLRVPVPYSPLCLLCSCCTSGRRTTDKTGTASISKARTEYWGRVAGAERPVGPIATVLHGLWHVARKHHAAASGPR